MSETRILNAKELAAMAQASASQACNCPLRNCIAWESITENRWPAAQMRHAGTLRTPDVAEPTYEEHHPHGTRYDSPHAPVALEFFPYNRCDVHHCSQCDQHVLRYTEFGGYYVDHRVRYLTGTVVLSP
jgi:hypothetical protein